MILSPKTVLLFLLISVFPITNLLLADAVIELREDTQHHMMGLQVEFLEDRKGTLILDDVRSEKYSPKFQPSDKIVPSFGYTRSVYWLRFTIKNPLPVEKQMFLAVNHPFMKQITLYYANRNTAFLQKTAGLAVDPGGADLKTRHHVFDMLFPSQSETNFYMRFVNDGPMGLPLTLYEPDFLSNQTNIEHLVLGVFYGTLLAMLVYTFFIFLSLRDRSYFFYLLFLGAISIYQLTVDGIGYRYLWPNSEWIRLNSAIVSWNLCIATYFSFSRSFLNAKQNTPRLDAILLAIIGLSLLNAGCSQFSDRIFCIKSTAFLQIAATLLALTIAIICLTKKKRAAFFYSGAMLFLLSGTTLTLLKNAGILPSHFITVWGAHIGIAAEVLLLSIGLADRMNIIKKEKFQAVQNQERAEQQRLLAESAIEAKSEYISHVSHELRIPMQGVIGFAKLGIHRFKTLTDEKKFQYFKEIHNSGTKQLSILNNLLDLSRLESSKADFNFEPVKLSDATDVILNELYAIISDKELKVITSQPGFDDTISIDREKIEQVLRNLIGNAIKFSTENGEIRIEIIEMSSDIQFMISDNGVGIPAEELKTIFEPFVQSSQNRSDSGGTGLGLAISKRIIEAHNGQIWAETTPEGGAIFKFQIPR